jgi:hypothetical protein
VWRPVGRGSPVGDEGETETTQIARFAFRARLTGRASDRRLAVHRARSATRSKPVTQALRASGRSTWQVDESATGSVNLFGPHWGNPTGGFLPWHPASGDPAKRLRQPCDLPAPANVPARASPAKRGGACDCRPYETYRARRLGHAAWISPCPRRTCPGWPSPGPPTSSPRLERNAKTVTCGSRLRVVPAPIDP